MKTKGTIMYKQRNYKESVVKHVKRAFKKKKAFKKRAFKKKRAYKKRAFKKKGRAYASWPPHPKSAPD